MIDPVIRTQSAGLLQFLFVSRGCNDAGMEELCNLNGRDANARAGSEHQDCLARTDAGAAHQHVPCRKKHKGHASRLIEIEAVGNWNYVYSGHGNEFAIGAVYTVAKNGKLRAFGFHSGDTLLTVITEVHRREEHALAGLEPSYIFAGLDDFSRNIAAQDVRQVDARETLADPNIKMVQGASSDANQHLILARFRIRNIFVAQDFRTAKFVNADGFHVSSDTKSNYHIRSAKIAHQATRSLGFTRDFGSRLPLRSRLLNASSSTPP